MTHTEIAMPNLPPPPVPQKLREMLKDYPEHIEQLQEVLAQFATPKLRLMPFDEAIWALEGRLETFMSEASTELQAAEASGDAQAIAKAKEKEFAMGVALSNMWMPDLQAYFEIHKEAFE
jgi:hypothetical protein